MPSSCCCCRPLFRQFILQFIWSRESHASETHQTRSASTVVFPRVGLGLINLLAFFFINKWKKRPNHPVLDPRLQMPAMCSYSIGQASTRSHTEQNHPPFRLSNFCMCKASSIFLLNFGREFIQRLLLRFGKQTAEKHGKGTHGSRTKLNWSRMQQRSANPIGRSRAGALPDTRFDSCLPTHPPTADKQTTDAAVSPPTLPRLKVFLNFLNFISNFPITFPNSRWYHFLFFSDFFLLLSIYLKFSWQLFYKNYTKRYTKDCST